MRAIYLILAMESSRSTAVSAAIFEDIMRAVWRGVGENTAASMAPQATGLQCLWAIETLVKIAASTEYRSVNNLILEKDPIAAKMDNLATGTVDTEQKIEKPAEEQNKTVRLDEKSKSFFSEKSKKSMRSSKFTEAIADKKSNADIAEKPASQTFFISLGAQEEPDGKQQNMRRAENDRFADQTKLKKAIEDRLKEKQKNAFANEKILKDKKPFTFDYEGTYYGINPSKLPLDTIRKMKDQYSKPEIMFNKDRELEPTNILNEKMKEREARSNIKPAIEKDKPIFSAKSFSIAEALNDPSQVAEGVKITEIRGENKNITREHKAKKLEGLKMYRLKEYQTFSKDKSFRQFPKSISKKSSLLNVSSSEAQNKEEFSAKIVKFEKPTHKSTGKSQQSIKGADNQFGLDNALGRGLPFIRTKGLRFHDLGSTFKTLELNPSSKRSSHKAKSSRIHISDTLLYEQSFLD